MPVPRFRRALLTVMVALGVVLGGIGWALPSLGVALVAEQALPRADAILMLAAGPLPWSRLLETALQARRLPESTVLITRTQAPPPGGPNPHGDLSFHEETRRALIRLGVSPHRLIVMPDIATSTLSELCLLRAQAARQGYRAILLVTDRAHSARTLATAHAVLPEGLAVGVAPSRFDPFEPDAWWVVPEHRRDVLAESVKWLNFFRERLLAQWSWFSASADGKPQDRLCRLAALPAHLNRQEREGRNGASGRRTRESEQHIQTVADVPIERKDQGFLGVLGLPVRACLCPHGRQVRTQTGALAVGNFGSGLGLPHGVLKL